MLADSSSNTVSNGFPAGGGTGSIQVGFSSTPSTTAQPLVISPTIPHQRRRLMPNGRRHEYTAVVTTAASATVSHNTGEISGSNVRVNILSKLTCGRSARRAGDVSPPSHRQHFLQTHVRKIRSTTSSLNRHNAHPSASHVHSVSRESPGSDNAARKRTSRPPARRS